MKKEEGGSCEESQKLNRKRNTYADRDRLHSLDVGPVRFEVLKDRGAVKRKKAIFNRLNKLDAVTSSNVQASRKIC